MPFMMLCAASHSLAAASPGAVSHLASSNIHGAHAATSRNLCCATHEAAAAHHAAQAAAADAAATASGGTVATPTSAGLIMLNQLLPVQGQNHRVKAEEQQQQQQQRGKLREECSVGMMPGHFVMLSRQWGPVVKLLQGQRNKRKAEQAFQEVPFTGEPSHTFLLVFAGVPSTFLPFTNGVPAPAPVQIPYLFLFKQQEEPSRLLGLLLLQAKGVYSFSLDTKGPVLRQLGNMHLISATVSMVPLVTIIASIHHDHHATLARTQQLQ